MVLPAVTVQVASAPVVRIAPVAEVLPAVRVVPLIRVAPCYVTTGTFTRRGFGLMSRDKALGGVLALESNTECDD